jgi:hypothetical protein
MQAPAIDDHVTTKLYAWYTIVSEWEPPGEGFTGICRECTASALACTIDIAAWPHDVIHLLVQSLRSAVADVRDSYAEEAPWDAAAAPEVARLAVARALRRHAPDIEDVLEQCLSDRLQAYLTQQADRGEQLRRRAAS